MSEFSGLWKHQNNPACITTSKNVRIFSVEVGRYTEEEQGQSPSGLAPFAISEEQPSYRYLCLLEEVMAVDHWLHSKSGVKNVTRPIAFKDSHEIL